MRRYVVLTTATSATVFEDDSTRLLSTWADESPRLDFGSRALQGQSACFGRRVDLSKQLRGVLMDLPDSRLLVAMMVGKNSIADDLVFPSRTGTVLKPDNIAPRYVEPALAKSGIRRVRFHDMRHSYGSFLIQDGASLAYVASQMGHSNIQITVDTYGHLIPGADIAWVDRLDAPSAQQQNATHVQPTTGMAKQEDAQLVKKKWLPPRDSNPDMLIQSPTKPSTGQSVTDATSANSGKVLQNPQAPRKQTDCRGEEKL
jgi:hypothetical protein